MIIKFDDKEYKLDLDDVSLTEARYLYRQCNGMTLGTLKDGLSDLNPDHVAALYWLMKAQNGETVDMGKLNFKVVKFMTAVGDAIEADQAEELGLTVEELRECVQEAIRRDVPLSDVLPARPENPTETPVAEEPALPTS